MIDRGPTYGEEYRRQCLVRHVLRLRDDPAYVRAQPFGGDGERAGAKAWLDAYERKTKDKTLRPVVIDQWDRGNRGARGDWRA